MEKKYPIKAENSTVCGDPGTWYDWSKFDWQGNSIHKSKCFECDHGHQHRAPLPWIDGKAEQYYEYLHVPYNWSDDMRILRVRPHFEVGQRRWKYRVTSVRAEIIDGIWNWVITLTKQTKDVE